MDYGNTKIYLPESHGRKFNSKVISLSWSFQKRFPTPAPVCQNLISKCQTRDRGTLPSKFVVTIHLSSYLYRHGFFRKKEQTLGPKNVQILVVHDWNNTFTDFKFQDHFNDWLRIYLFRELSLFTFWVCT